MLVCYRIGRHWHTLLDIRGANDAGLLSPHHALQFFGFSRGLPVGARLGVILKRNVHAHAGKERCQTMMDQERSIYNEGALGGRVVRRLCGDDGAVDRGATIAALLAF